MIYISVNSHWHIHIAVLCIILQIDHVLVCNDDKFFIDLHRFYSDNVSRLCNGYIVDFGTSMNFKRRNFTICRSKSVQENYTVLDLSNNHSIQDCEELFFKFLDEKGILLSNVTQEWRVFMPWSYKMITSREMSRSMYLYHAVEQSKLNFTRGEWLIQCHFMPHSKHIPLHIFSIQTPPIALITSEHKNVVQEWCCDINSVSLGFNPHAKITIWLNPLIKFTGVIFDWQQIIYLCCRPDSIWCSQGMRNGLDLLNHAIGGCGLCDMEYNIKKHGKHMKISRLWLFGNTNDMATLFKNVESCDIRDDIEDLIQFHFKSCIAIQGKTI